MSLDTESPNTLPTSLGPCMWFLSVYISPSAKHSGMAQKPEYANREENSKLQMTDKDHILNKTKKGMLSRKKLAEKYFLKKADLLRTLRMKQQLWQLCKESISRIPGNFTV